MTHLSTDDVWETMIKHYKEDYSNLVHMIEVLLLVPGKAKQISN